jgi:hypothetical protein
VGSEMCIRDRFIYDNDIFELDFKKFFIILEKINVSNTKRDIYFMKKIISE